VLDLCSATRSVLDGSEFFINENCCRNDRDIFALVSNKYQQKWNSSPPTVTNIVFSPQTTKYFSVATTESTENTASSSSPILVTLAIPMPAKLPCPTKLTSTGKNPAASSPPTVNINEPERESSEIKGMDQAREWEEGLRDHSPV